MKKYIIVIIIIILLFIFPQLSIGTPPQGDHEPAIVIFNVKSYGAVGDDSNDDTVAIQAAMDGAEALADYSTVIVPSGTYKVTDTLELPCKVNMHMDGLFKFYGTGEQTILDVCQVADVEQNEFVTYEGIWVERNFSDRSDWSDGDDLEAGTYPTDICVSFNNLADSQVKIKRARNCTVGVQLVGDGKIASYNYFELGQLSQNKYGFAIISKNSAGFANQNKVEGGRVAVGADSRIDDLSRYGLLLYAAPGGAYEAPDGNTFYSPSLEVSNSDATGTAWASSTAYSIGDIVVNDAGSDCAGKKYKATAAGTSAASGGPTGFANSITDGGVTWKFIELDGGFGVLNYGGRLNATILTRSEANNRCYALEMGVGGNQNMEFNSYEILSGDEASEVYYAAGRALTQSQSILRVHNRGGIPLPRVTTTEKNSTSPSTGTLVEDVNTTQIEHYNGTSWETYDITP